THERPVKTGLRAARHERLERALALFEGGKGRGHLRRRPNVLGTARLACVLDVRPRRPDARLRPSPHVPDRVQRTLEGVPKASHAARERGSDRFAEPLARAARERESDAVARRVTSNDARDARLARESAAREIVTKLFVVSLES